MKRYKKALINSIMALIVISIACGGGKESSMNLSSANFLPEKIAPTGIERSSDIRTFTGESLYEYIDGGAEIYHLYNFIEAATADYKLDDKEFVADIYRFDNADNAFGLYTMFRPDDPEIIPFGIEGFISGASLDFIKGCFLVRLVGYDESASTIQGIRSLAKELNDRIPGTTALPMMFSLFPPDNKIRFTDKYYAESYLGQKFLTNVYCQNYFINGDTLTLFISFDELNDKFRQWSKHAVIDNESKPALKDIPYDEREVIIIDDRYYGTIITGLKENKLLGIVNYNDKHKQFLTAWLDTLP